MIFGKQIKAGRILLEITQEKLSEETKTPIATLRRIENSNQISSSAATLGKIQTFLENEGIKFKNDDNVIGVVLIRGKEKK